VKSTDGDEKQESFDSLTMKFTLHGKRILKVSLEWIERSEDRIAHDVRKDFPAIPSLSVKIREVHSISIPFITLTLVVW